MANTPRCPLCATSLNLRGGVLASLFGPKLTRCPTCLKQIARRDARAMGDSFAHWADQMQDQLTKAAEQLSILHNPRALHAMYPGLSLEQVRPAATFEALAHYVGQVFRPILADQAHGRRAQLHVALLEDKDGSRILGVLGRTGVESGERETELLVARIGKARYQAYVPTQPTGRVAEHLRARRATAPTLAPPPAPQQV